MTIEELLEPYDVESIGELVSNSYNKGRADAFNQKEDADGCVGCAFEDTDEWCLPCMKCKRNAKDYWRPKEQKNDRVGI